MQLLEVLYRAVYENYCKSFERKPVKMKKLIPLVFVFFCSFSIISTIVRETSFVNLELEASALNEETLFLTKEQMLADYDEMWLILETEFPLWELSDQYGLISLEEKKLLKEKYRKRIEEIIQFEDGMCLYLGNTPCSSEDFFYLTIQSCLSNFNDLGHLKLVPSTQYNNSIDLNSTISDKFYAKLSGNPSLNTHVIDPASIDLSGQELEKFISLTYDNGVPIIRLKTFSIDTIYQKAISDRLEEICEQIMDEPHVIIDIRGNDGGSSFFWQYSMRKLFYGKAKAHTIKVTIPDSLWSYFNESNPKVSYQVLRRHGSLIDVDLYLPVGSMVTSAEEPYEGELWILVDGEVASSAELLVRWAKSVNAATIIGTRTRGMGGYGAEPVLKYHMLSNSGLWMYYEWIIYYNDDGSVNQFWGTEPDLFSEFPQETCLEAIKNIVH